MGSQAEVLSHTLGSQRCLPQKRWSTLQFHCHARTYEGHGGREGGGSQSMAVPTWQRAFKLSEKEKKMDFPALNDTIKTPLNVAHVLCLGRPLLSLKDKLKRNTVFFCKCTKAPFTSFSISSTLCSNGSIVGDGSLIKIGVLPCRGLVKQPTGKVLIKKYKSHIKQWASLCIENRLNPQASFSLWV